jgi:hypothetical protein
MTRAHIARAHRARRRAKYSDPDPVGTVARRRRVQDELAGVVEGQSVTMVSSATYNAPGVVFLAPATVTRVHRRGPDHIASLSVRDELTGRVRLFFVGEWGPEGQRDRKAFHRARKSGAPDVEQWRLELFPIAAVARAVRQRLHSAVVPKVLLDDGTTQDPPDEARP